MTPGGEPRRTPGSREQGPGNPHPEHPVFRISVVAEMVGVHQQTLRSYERLGLVTPARSSGNSRLYSVADVDRVRQVIRLVDELGLNLAGADVVLRMRSQIEEMHVALQRQARELEKAHREIERLRRSAAW